MSAPSTVTAFLQLRVSDQPVAATVRYVRNSEGRVDWHAELTGWLESTVAGFGDCRPDELAREAAVRLLTACLDQARAA